MGKDQKQSREEITGHEIKNSVSVERVIESADNSIGVTIKRTITQDKDSIIATRQYDNPPATVKFVTTDDAIEFCELVLKIAKMDGAVPKVK